MSKLTILVVLLACQLHASNLVLYNGNTIPVPPALGEASQESGLKFIYIESPSLFLQLAWEDTRHGLGCYLFRNPPPPLPPPPPSQYEGKIYTLAPYYSYPSGVSVIEADGSRIYMDPCGKIELSDGLSYEHALRMVINNYFEGMDSVNQYYATRDEALRKSLADLRDLIAKREKNHTTYDLSEAPLDKNPKHRAAFLQAVSLWSIALGRPLPIKMPELYVVPTGVCGGLQDSVACAANGSVYVEDLSEEDAKTIMMHEIGHLLGVPHIDKDPLMHAAYIGKLDKPSDAAVALAKLRMGVK